MIGRLGGLVAAPLRRVWRAVRVTGRTVARVPDVVEAVLVLPTLSQQLAVIEFQTASLADMHAELARVRGNTSTLPVIDERLEQVVANTAYVEQMHGVLLPLSGAMLRLGKISDRWPARRLPPG
jgi:hypothetical protein